MNRSLRSMCVLGTALVLIACAAVATAADSPAAGDDTTSAEQARRDRLRAYVPGRGIQLADGDWGELRFRLLTYVRYLNQSGLDDTSTDSFGTVRNISPRQDVQLNKMNFYFSGWFMDPRLHYLGYVWTSNPSQGLGAQVVVAGNVGFRFNEHFNVGGGIGGLPGTRTVEGNWPLWLSVDNRLIADEFFRPSYTSGFWSRGRIVDRVNYWVMLGNNLSQLGVDAGQLDNTLDTFSGVVTWMPTTGEFGTAGGFGDFDHHEQVATRFGLHYTSSTENRQSQPSTEAPENSQIRLSDGNVIFNAGLFGPGIAISDVRYRMVAFDAGVKHRGLALEGEFYWRHLDEFRGTGTDQLGFSDMNDSGFQLQASAMVLPRTLQAYLCGASISGEHGDPWEMRLGLNWYPWQTQAVRVNGEVIRVDQSPVGGLSLPLQVGANGTVFYANVEVYF